MDQPCFFKVGEGLGEGFAPLREEGEALGIIIDPRSLGNSPLVKTIEITRDRHSLIYCLGRFRILPSACP